MLEADEQGGRRRRRWAGEERERGALIRIISRCAACANVENVLPSVKGWGWQQVLLLLPAGHTLTNTHSHTHTLKCRTQTARSVCQICMSVCVEAGVCVCVCGLVGFAEHDDEQMSEGRGH